MRSIWCVVAAGLLISAVARPLDARWRGWEANRSEKWQPNSVPSGYDPFQLNWSTGRFQYVPIPYDTFSGPYAFNWHSGRWDYVPYAPPPAVEYFNGKRDEGS